MSTNITMGGWKTAAGIVENFPAQIAQKVENAMMLLRGGGDGQSRNTCKMHFNVRYKRDQNFR